jgi:putative ATP-dependent endonuclease of OLD family
VAQDFVQDWEFQNLTGAALANLPDSAILTLQNEVSYYYLAALRDAAKHFDAKGSFWRPFLKESQLTPEKREEIESKLAEVNQLIVESHGSFAQVVDRLKELNQVLSMDEGVGAR